MAVLVDSNVLLDVLTSDTSWYQWSASRLHNVMIEEGASINPLIYAEISVGFENRDDLDSALAPLSLTRISLPWDAAFVAGKAYLRYRRRGGLKQSPMPDFYIGAHAQIAHPSILTRDPNRYRTYFPSVELIAPS